MIHPLASVSPEAALGSDVSIGPFAVVEADTTIGDGCEIRAHAVIKRFTTLGWGNRVHEGAVLGGEPQDLSWDGSNTELVLGDRNVIREHVTIHRASKPGGRTLVGSDCFLMAGVHIAHDCVIGNRVVMANVALLSGHIHVGDRAFVSGGALIHQFCRIGRLAMVGGGARATMDCLPFVISEGHPAHARGLNVVGLRRAGVSASERQWLKQAYRLLLRSGLPLDAALGQMAEMKQPLVDEMVAFCRASQRGFLKAVRESEPE